MTPPSGSAGEPRTGAGALCPGAMEARFLAVVSHELRTPLTTIASFTESLDADDLPPAERSLALAAVRRNTDRMLTLVEDLMLISRVQTGDLHLHPVNVTPAEVLREAAGALAVHEPHTATVLDVPDGHPVTGDAALLHLLAYAVLGTLASAAADRSATVRGEVDPAGWTLTAEARQAEQLTDEQLMAGTLALPDPPHRRRSTALWFLLATAIAGRHGGTLRLTYDPAVGAGAVVTLPFT